MGANDELPAGWLAAICHNGDASADSAAEYNCAVHGECREAECASSSSLLECRDVELNVTRRFGKEAKCGNLTVVVQYSLSWQIQIEILVYNEVQRFHKLPKCQSSREMNCW